ncbi:hypothetical protein ACFLXH_03765 [Chloroflexota bacterium]
MIILTVSRDTKVLIVVSIFLVIVWVSMFFHESGHYISALILGVSHSNITFHWAVFLPIAVSVPIDSLSSAEKIIFSYSGGLSSGFLLLITALFSFIQYRRNHSIMYWWLGTFAIGFSMMEFYEGYREGASNLEYKDFAFLEQGLIILITTMSVLIAWKFKKHILQLFKKLLIPQ